MDRRFLRIISFALALIFGGAARAQFADQGQWAGLAGNPVSPNAIVLTLAQVTDLDGIIGVPLRFLVNQANTGSVTIEIDYNSVQVIPPTAVRQMTNSGAQLLAGGEFQPGTSSNPNIVTVVFTGTYFVVSTPAPRVQPTSNSFRNWTSSGTYPTSAGVTRATMECWGAGGGGWTVAFGSLAAGDGGGGGEHRIGTFAVIPLTSYTVTIGAGGGPDAAGGASSIGSFITANGGGGALGSNGIGATGGAGGTGGSGGVGEPGQMGNAGFTTGNHDILLGNGGSAAFGSGPSQPISNVTGHQSNGTFPGGGGTGGNGGGGAGSPTAGSGSGGYCRVQELTN